MLIGYKIFLSVLSKVLSKKISTFSQKLSSFTTQRTFQINSQKKSARLTRTWFNRGQGRIPVVTEKQRIKLALHQTSSSSIIMVSVTFWLDEVQEGRGGEGREGKGRGGAGREIKIPVCSCLLTTGLENTKSCLRALKTHLVPKAIRK